MTNHHVDLVAGEEHLTRIRILIDHDSVLGCIGHRLDLDNHPEPEPRQGVLGLVLFHPDQIRHLDRRRA